MWTEWKIEILLIKYLSFSTCLEMIHVSPTLQEYCEQWAQATFKNMSVSPLPTLDFTGG